MLSRAAGAPISLVPERLVDVVAVVGGEAQLFTDTPVPQLGERLRQLDGQPVQLQIVAVGVPSEEFRGHLADARSDGHELEGDDIDLTRVLGPEEVGEAEEARAALP